MDEVRAKWLARHVLPNEPMLRKWLAMKPLGGMEIDDVVQETYAILAELKSVDGIQNPRSYTFQVAHSVVHAQFRRSRIVEFRGITDADVDALLSDQPSPEHQTADKEFLRAVESYIKELPTKCREVILLRRVQNLSYRAISERLGISERSVEKLMFKGMQKLINRFERGEK